MEEEMHSIPYWENINQKIINIHEWIDENKIHGIIDAEEVKKLVDFTFELEK